MAISLEFIDFVIPVATIRAKYPGGWLKCLADHSALLGGRVWHDEHLFRDGAMSPRDIETLVHEWAELGFHPLKPSMDSAIGKTSVWSSQCLAGRPCHAAG